MKTRKAGFVCWILFICICINACSGSKSSSGGQPLFTVRETAERSLDPLNLKPGITAYNASAFNYIRNGRSALRVEMKEPVVVAVASKPEKWGFFQFPRIERSKDNALLISWNLNADAMEAYGSHQNGAALSTDGGITWQPSDEKRGRGGAVLPNGDRIKVHTPKPVKASELILPKSIGTGLADTYSKSTYEYYRLHELPEQVNGVYLERLSNGSDQWVTERASLFDPQAARYTLRGMFPVVWWGDVHIAPDESLIAGVYPGFEISTNSVVGPYHQVFFYRSVDHGRSWKIQGRLRYAADTVHDPKGRMRMGFTEPTYEILPGGTFVCVSRTTDGIGNGPMYISRSTDMGVNWTRPEILTSSGVLPRLLQLENGVTVLAYGRPGVQIRFSADGEGKVWTDAFEMMPYKDYSDQVSCGYTGLVATGPDRFLIVYSDFKFLNKEGEPRKAIKVREVIVRPSK